VVAVLAQCSARTARGTAAWIEESISWTHAEQSAAAAEELTAQSAALKEIMTRLTDLVGAA
jgi:hypothetical protein